MKIAVVGSRSFDDYDLLVDTLSDFDISEIVSGGASGADSLAEKYAKLFLIPTNIIKPNWSLYGKAAGMIRNTDIVKSSDHVVAFWDGVSKGTANSIKTANKLNVPTTIIRFKNEVH